MNGHRGSKKRPHEDTEKSDPRPGGQEARFLTGGGPFLLSLSRYLGCHRLSLLCVEECDVNS